MAKIKVIWSDIAMKRLYGIFESVIRKNGTKSGLKKLFRLFSKKLKFLSKNPGTGLKTSDDQTRGLIVANYLFLYQATKKRIVIHTIFDFK